MSFSALARGCPDDENAERTAALGVAPLGSGDRGDLRSDRVAGQGCAFERAGECAQDPVGNPGEPLCWQGRG